MKIPVVMSTVHIRVDADGRLHVAVDKQPYADDRVLSREHLQSVLDEITSKLETAVRVEIQESDGATFSDYATPPQAPTSPEEPPLPTPAPALAGAGFKPGEEVAVAYIVTRQAADEDGNAAIDLPPAVLNAARSGLVLFGLSSLTVARVEASA